MPPLQRRYFLFFAYRPQIDREVDPHKMYWKLFLSIWKPLYMLYHILFRKALHSHELCRQARAKLAGGKSKAKKDVECSVFWLEV